MRGSTQFRGTEVSVDNVDGFSMSGLTLESIYGTDNREINIDGAIITGAPAIDFDNSAGTFSNLEVDCGVVEPNYFSSRSGFVFHCSIRFYRFFMYEGR